jgi:II/X family phage/plasmid replication protein
MKTPFIDWLTITQTHPLGSLPIVADGRIIAMNNDESEIEWDSLKHLQHKGSYDTALRIRCDGSTVMLSGNIGRFGRPDNLFGMDWENTLAKANRILAHFNLPPFTQGERVVKQSITQYDIKHGLFEVWTGAKISNIHLTVNYETGSPDNAQSVINWLDSQSVSHIKKGRVGGTTASYGSKAGRKLLKFYIKAPEMMAHCKGAAERLTLSDSLLYNFVKSRGIVRAELEAHLRLLTEAQLRYIGDITMAKLIQLFESQTEIINRVRIDVQDFDISTLPSAVRSTALLYQKGEDVHAFLSQRTFYRHAKILRGFGIDITAPNNVKAFPLPKVQIITIQPCAVPEWYWEASKEA